MKRLQRKRTTSKDRGGLIPRSTGQLSIGLGNGPHSYSSIVPFMWGLGSEIYIRK